MLSESCLCDVDGTLHVNDISKNRGVFKKEGNYINLSVTSKVHHFNLAIFDTPFEDSLVLAGRV